MRCSTRAAAGCSPRRCRGGAATATRASSPYETYEAADRPIAVAVGNDRLFARLCEAVGAPELACDERYATNAARVANADSLAERLEAAFREAVGGRVGRDACARPACPVGPINDVAEAWALAEELGLEPVAEADGMPLPAPPLRLDGERPPVARRPPRLDEHGDESAPGWRPTPTPDRASRALG